MLFIGVTSDRKRDYPVFVLSNVSTYLSGVLVTLTLGVPIDRPFLNFGFSLGICSLLLASLLVMSFFPTRTGVDV